VTLIVAALAAIALVLAVGTADLARVLVAAARAQTAADLAALAAARELALPGEAEPAAVAAAYAARNGAVLVSCRCDPGTFEAVVAVRLPVGPLLLFDDARSVETSARAVVVLPDASPPVGTA
jgi:secretion/DNA translocation related TadE-like protein